MNYARLLDLQDRYVNSKATKYYLRSDNIDRAVATIFLFTKKDVDPVEDLVEMQSFWFINALAEAHERLGNHAMALKYFHVVDRTFADVYDDQFDFHSYSIRKCVLRAYVEMIQFEDSLHKHPYFRRAAEGIVRINLRLVQLDTDLIDYALDALQLSESIPRRKKEAVDEDGREKTPDGDPHGLSYLHLNKTTEAIKFSTTINTYSPNDILGWAMSCEAFMANCN